MSPKPPTPTPNPPAGRSNKPPAIELASIVPPRAVLKPGTSTPVRSVGGPDRVVQPPGRVHAAITTDPEPAITVTSLSTRSSASATVTTQTGLHHYTLTVKNLPEADLQGLRTLKGRDYVEMTDGQIVHVALERATGLYRAKKLNELEPSGPALSRNEGAHTWRLATAIAGGSDRKRRINLLEQKKINDAQTLEEIRTKHEQLQAFEGQHELRQKALANAPNAAAERVARVAFEVYLRKHIALLEEHIGTYERQKSLLMEVKNAKLYKGELASLLASQVEGQSRLLLLHADNFDADIRGLNLNAITDALPFREYNEKLLANMLKKLPVLEKRQATINSFLKLAPGQDTQAMIKKVMLGADFESHHARLIELTARAHLLTWGAPAILGQPKTYNFEATFQSTRFREAATTLDQLVLVPQDKHIALLDNLLDQTVSVRNQYESMTQYPPGTPEAAHRAAIIEVLHTYETLVEARLVKHHSEALDNSSLSRTLDDIDLDFLPPQQEASPTTQAAPRKRLIRVHHQGSQHIKIGEEHIAADGSMIIKTVDPSGPRSELLGSYEKHGNEWRGIAPKPAIEVALPELVAQADLQLRVVDSHLDKATRDEKAKQSPTNIVEFLAGKAEQLDQHAHSIRLSIPATGNVDAQAAAGRLELASQRLRAEGEAIRVRLYKDPSVLNVARLLYLIDNQHVTALKIKDRVLIGKGKSKHFLDAYSIRDKQSNRELWHAHFHYPARDTPASNF